MERSTKKIVTPSGINVEVKEYITGREAREIQSIFLSGMEVKIGADGKQEPTTVNPELVNKAQDKTIELLVVSVNDSKENILKTVLDLPKADFDCVVEAIDGVKDGLGKKK
tara:strand:- start:4454 stop:4786 length:333 start_codon:yes stop_codon:yes gene_type:complete